MTEAAEKKVEKLLRQIMCQCEAIEDLRDALDWYVHQVHKMRQDNAWTDALWQDQGRMATAALRSATAHLKEGQEGLPSLPDIPPPHS